LLNYFRIIGQWSEFSAIDIGQEEIVRGQHGSQSGYEGKGLAPGQGHLQKCRRDGFDLCADSQFT
jgi:hypothetical protein